MRSFFGVSVLVLFVVTVAEVTTAFALADEVVFDGSPTSETESRFRPVAGTRGMVVSDDADASAWGAEILRQGGNAMDAAVATAFYMSVSRPQFASLGGGGFLIYCPAPGVGIAPGKKVDQGSAKAAFVSPVKEGKQSCEALDFREVAPLVAKADFYIRNGKADDTLSKDGALAVGVPGVPAGLTQALERWGSLPRAKVLARPIAVARSGVRWTAYAESGAEYRWPAMNVEARRLFGCGTSKPCPVGAWVKQPELARVLEAISKSGAAGFYDGWVAQKLVAGIRAGGGVISMADLSGYHARLREPVVGEYRGLEVVSMSPPSAGGTVLLQMLKYAEMADQMGALSAGWGSAKTWHALAHAMTLGFADRAVHFGDPDSVKVPLAGLLNSSYLSERWSKTFDQKRAKFAEGPGEPPRDSNTTHLSVVDREGNAVSLTTTVNDDFGSGFVAPGTGVVLNNEMDDFAIQPGVPNLFGLVGAEANAVGPRKRPLSSMSPTIVRDAGGYPRLVLGAQGGPRITTSVFQIMVARLKFGLSLPEATLAPRIHHQWKPASLFYERGGAFSAETLESLKGYGYELRETQTVGKAHVIERFSGGRVWGVNDPRAEGAAVAE